MARAAWAALVGIALSPRRLHSDVSTASTRPTRSPFTEMQITLKSKSLCPEVPEMKTDFISLKVPQRKVTSQDIRVRTPGDLRAQGSPHFPQAALAGTAGCRVQHRGASALTASWGHPCSWEPRGVGRDRQPAGPPPGPLHRTDSNRHNPSGLHRSHRAVSALGCPCPTAWQRCRHRDTLSEVAEHLPQRSSPECPPTARLEVSRLLPSPQGARAGPGWGRAPAQVRQVAFSHEF